MSNTDPKYKVFSIVTYAESDQINDILEHHFSKGVIDSYAFVLHDKDFNDDGTRKEPHHHIVLQSSVHRTEISVRNWFKGTTDYKGLRANTIVQATREQITKDGIKTIEKVDTLGATCYLAHEDKQGNPIANKYHYGWDFVTSKNIELLKAVPSRSGRQAKEDRTFEILEKVMSGANFYDLAREYGRDFILNWQKYKDLCQYCFGRSLEEEQKRKEKERLDFELTSLAESCQRMSTEEILKQENEILKAQLVCAGIRFEKE